MQPEIIYPNQLEPLFIRQLFDPDAGFSLYLGVGSAFRNGGTERIGVDDFKLKAHSAFWRRVLDCKYMEIKEHWDINIPELPPDLFRNILRYAYGYNTVGRCNLQQSMKLLSCTQRWKMKAMSLELAKHVIKIMSPNNIHTVLSSPVCLEVPRIEEAISNMISEHLVTILKHQNMKFVCSAVMRHIIIMDSKRKSSLQEEVWTATVKWARNRILHQIPMSSLLEKYIGPVLLGPFVKHHLCALNIVDVLDEAIFNPQYMDIETFVSHYHTVPENPIDKIVICTASKNEEHVTHEEFHVKNMHLSPTNYVASLKNVYTNASSFAINTGKHAIELKYLVCSGTELEKVGNFHENKKCFYSCGCKVFIKLIGEENEKLPKVFKFYFKEEVRLRHDFEIPLVRNGKTAVLHPNKKYITSVKFTVPHPILNFDKDATNFQSNDDFSINCNLVCNSSKPVGYGSHAKYILFRKLKSESQTTTG